jgi:hypothetical protein
MNRRALWINVALAAGVAALGLWMLAGPKGGLPDKGTADAGPKTRLATLDAARVATIRVTHAGQPTIELQRDGTVWRQVAPFPARIDPSRVSRLLDMLAATSTRQLPAKELEQFGLEPPGVVVEFDKVRYAFGAMNPITSDQYVQVGDQVHLVAPVYAYGLPAPRDTLASHMLLAEDEQPDAFVLPDLARIARVDGKWTRTPAFAADATPSQDAFVKWSEQWRYASAMATAAAPELRKRAGDRVDVTFSNGRRADFVIVQRTPAFVVVRDDEKLQFTFAVEEGAKLLVPPGPAPTTPAAPKP